MRRDLPKTEKQKLESKLYLTVEIQKRIVLHPPPFVAVQLGAKSRTPNAWAVLHHASNAVQAARFHLYMAMYERLRYRKYLKPPDARSGDMLADLYFTSFALHAVAAEGHMALSLARLFGMPGAGPKGFNAPASHQVYGFLRRKSGAKDFSKFLAPFQNRDEDWTWLKKFRNRWAHMNPVRVKELGIQYSMDFKRESFWTGKPDRQSIAIGGGDPAETDVREMLDRGVRAFNLFAKQFDMYTEELEQRLAQFEGRLG